MLRNQAIHDQRVPHGRQKHKSCSNRGISSSEVPRYIFLSLKLTLDFSHISGNLLAGSVADVYRYGASLWLFSVAYVIMDFLAVYVYLPVFFKMQVINIHEYLEKRFDKKTRMLAFVFYVFSKILVFLIHAYTPSWTFATGTVLTLVTIC